MKTEHIKYLLTVEKCSSIHKASQQLHLNHQYLSKLIMTMEREIGTRIFERTPRGVHVTEEGAWVIEKLRAVDDEINTILRRYNALPVDERRNIRGALNYYSVLNIKPKEIVETIERFSESFPNISITMKELSVPEIVKCIEDDPWAIGSILYIDDLPEINPPIPEGVAFLPVFPCRFVAYVHESTDWLKDRKSISLTTLAQKEMVLYSPYDAEKNTTLAVLKALTVPNIKYVVSNLSSYYQLLASGRYVSLAALRASSTFAPEGMRYIPLKENIGGTIALVVQQQGLENEAAIKAFVDFYLSRYQ